MLVINRIGPTGIKKVVLRLDVVVVYMVDGTEISYRRVVHACSEEVQVRRSSQTSGL